MSNHYSGNTNSHSHLMTCKRIQGSSLTPSLRLKNPIIVQQLSLPTDSTSVFLALTTTTTITSRSFARSVRMLAGGLVLSLETYLPTQIRMQPYNQKNLK